MSNQSGKNGAELDRENAHFSVSEAMIAAIEEVLSQSIILNQMNSTGNCISNCRQDFMNGKIKEKTKKTNSSF